MNSSKLSHAYDNIKYVDKWDVIMIKQYWVLEYVILEYILECI